MFSEFTLEQWAWLAGAIAVRVLWQGAIIGLVAAVALALLRNGSPSARYVAGCAALLAFALLITANLAFAPDLPTPPPAPTDVPVPFRYPVAYNGSASTETAVPVSYIEEATVATPAAAPSPQRRDPRPRPVIAAWYEAALPWIGGFWAVGVLLFAVHDVVGLIAVARMRRRGEDAPADLLAMAVRVRQLIGIHAAVPIRVVEGISTAMVTGLFRVIILVPTAMVSGMTPEAVEAILAHEFAHLRRWDRWVNLLQCILETLLFFHPALWWVSRRVRIERELCCDELALRVCPDRGLYVRALLALADRPDAMPSTVFSSHGGNFSNRVRHILGLPRPRTYTKRQAGAASVLIVAGVLLSAMAWNRVTSANEHGAELRFSDLKAIGIVQARWEDDPRPTDDPWLTEYNAGWTVLEEAKGLVTIPKGAQVKLAIAKMDLSGLRDLPPNSIYFLDARFRDLTDNDLQDIGHLTGLRALDLSENRFNLHGPGLSSLAGLKQLEWLNLYFSPVETLPANSIAQFQNLRFLSGHFRHNSPQVLRELQNLRLLEFLSMRSAPVSADDLLYLNGKASLQGLVLFNMSLTDQIFGTLESLPRLRYLGLGNNALSDASTEVIEAFGELRHLDLHKTKIGDAGIRRLASLSRLETLNLAYTNVTTDCLDTLATLPSLYYVNFFETQVPEPNASRFMETISHRTEVIAPIQASSNPSAPRVGVFMSHFTCSGPVREGFEHGEHYSYGLQDSIALIGALNEANFDVYAVIEPDTQHLGELPSILIGQGLVNKVIDITDTQTILNLDAIITCAIYNVQPEILESLSDAVWSGVGLVSIGALGDDIPGSYDPLVERLTGMKFGEYINRGCQDSTVRVSARHALLEGIPTRQASNVRMLIGTAGEFDVDSGLVLIEGPGDFPAGFPALYVREFGQGRILRAQWHHPMQPGLPFPGYSLYIRALNWAAGRDVDAVW